MKSHFATKIIGIAEGRAVSLGKARNRKLSWGTFIKELETPVVTNERQKTFLKLPKEEQDKLKAVPGWLLGGATQEGRRRRSGILTRSLVTLDCDEITPEILEEIRSGESAICDFEFVAHTTRKHQAENPRLRLHILPTDDFDSEKYDAVSRILAEMIDPSMDMVDDVSFRSAQMMFKPSISKGQEFLHWVNPGKLVDVDDVLQGFRLDWRDYKNLPYSESRGQRRKTQDKAENPLSKRGIVGAFCRAYDVESAMEKFIPDVYLPGDDSGNKPRYSYGEGSTSNGVVVEDDGLFIYSHHGTDPCGETLCNAFDMVRTHLFDHLDKKKKEGSNPKDWPSYKAMEELLRDDDNVKSELLADRVDIDAMFDDISDPGEAEQSRSDEEDPDDVAAYILSPSCKGEGLPDLSKYDRPGKPAKNWHLKKLDLDASGAIKSTVPNIATIIQNDPRLHGAICLNELTGKVAVRKTIRPKLDIVSPIIVGDTENGEDWLDLHDYSIRAMLEAEAGEKKLGWGLRVTDRDLNAAVILVAHNNRFHPAVEYIQRVKWDGKRRIERMWIDYMGTPDTAYYRETSKLFLFAVISRIFNPGHKWDYAPILAGAQGIRKSSFIKSLFGSVWAGELTASMTHNTDAVEQMLGKLCLELPELATMRRGEVDDIKQFMTLTEDRVRLAYDRRMSTFPRQCVFIGTTNADEYLKDATGNRRFWPIAVQLPMIDTDRVEADRDQLWAEAYAAWREMAQHWGYRRIPLMLPPEADKDAKNHQALAQEEDWTEILAELIREWADTPIALSRFLEGEVGATAETDSIGGDQMVVPTVITPMMAGVLALNEDRKELILNKSRMAQIGNAMSRLEGWWKTGKKLRIPGFGQGHAYERREITASEKKLRYRVVCQKEELRGAAADDIL